MFVKFSQIMNKYCRLFTIKSLTLFNSINILCKVNDICE